MAHLGSPLLALRRLLMFACLTAIFLPAQFFAILLKMPLQKELPYRFHRQVRRFSGIRVELRGRRSTVRPTLFVCNHVSYLDITVLGSLIKGSFVAKAEIADWPFFSSLAKLQRSVFIDRRQSSLLAHREEMTCRLDHGDNLILFPEGTSGDGNRVLPFKSALFSVAELRSGDKALTVQPVSVAYTRLDGMPMGRFLRPYFAWYGDMELAGHLWECVGLGYLTVVVEFHPPVTIEDFGSRKALSDHCCREVRAGLAAALSGRPRASSGALRGDGRRVRAAASPVAG